MLFSYNNTSEIKAYIKALISNGEKSNELAINGLEKVLEFTTEKMLDELETFLRKNI